MWYLYNLYRKLTAKKWPSGQSVIPSRQRSQVRTLLSSLKILKILKKKVSLAGFEPATFSVRVSRSAHSATLVKGLFCD
jgi:hypothetical protein